MRQLLQRYLREPQRRVLQPPQDPYGMITTIARARAAAACSLQQSAAAECHGGTAPGLPSALRYMPAPSASGCCPLWNGEGTLSFCLSACLSLSAPLSLSVSLCLSR